MIQFKEVQIGYKDSLITIHDVNLEEGKIYALVGSNGSGKTTLLNTMIGKIKPLNGELIIDGTSIKKYNSKKLAQKVAYVESKFDGVEYLKVIEYIALGRTPYTDRFGRLTESDNKEIDRALVKLNIKMFSDRYTTQLSDGERQLTAIARAFVQTTPIIILDEPTAFLDYGNRKKLIGILSSLAKEEGKCILFSTHDIDLCLEEKLSIALIDQESKTLEIFSDELSKKELLQKGFGL